MQPGLRFWDRVRAICGVLGGKKQKLGVECFSYNALDFLTGPFLGDDLARIERVCSGLPGFVMRSDVTRTIGLDAIRNALHDRDLDPEAAIQLSHADIAKQYRRLAPIRNDLLQNMGKPFGDAGAACSEIRFEWRGGAVFRPSYIEERDIDECEDEMNRFLGQFADVLEEAGSLEVAEFLYARRMPDPEASRKFLAYLDAMFSLDTLSKEQSETGERGAEAVTVASTPSADQSSGSADPIDATARKPLSGHYRISFERSGLSADWLLNASDREKDGKRVPFDTAELVLFSIEKMLLDPRCGEITVKPKERKSRESGCPYPAIEPPRGFFYYTDGCGYVNYDGHWPSLPEEARLMLLTMVEAYEQDGTLAMLQDEVAVEAGIQAHTKWGKELAPAERLRKTPIWKTVMRAEGIVGSERRSRGQMFVLYRKPKKYPPPD